MLRLSCILKEEKDGSGGKYDDDADGLTRILPIRTDKMLVLNPCQSVISAQGFYGRIVAFPSTTACILGYFTAPHIVASLL